MDDLLDALPGGAVVLGLGGLIAIPGVRRRAVSVANAAVRGGIGVANAVVAGARDVAGAAVRKDTHVEAAPAAGSDGTSTAVPAASPS